MKLALLVSGGLGEDILKLVTEKFNFNVTVFTDKGSYGVIKFCEANKLLYYAGNPRKVEAESFIGNLNVDLILSVNYLFIINRNLIDKASKIAINIHGSLLPKYRGRTPHVWSIINGEKHTGVTAHVIDPGLDSGDIIFQEKVPITYDETGADVLMKYKEIYKHLVTRILTSNLDFERIQQDNSKATYFEKRTPEDGKLDFRWDKHRVRNWVRAQARPYPGSFFIYNGQKYITHRCEISDHGFRQVVTNGTVLKVDESGIVIKLTNGCVKFSQIEDYKPAEFKENTILE